ncbi:MAG TPA: hypothetical protein PLU30_04455 [Verrucomicrobiae bacterium]|nr:hypothetical protein [Verrucomicrobiae bacterium]
MAIGKPGGGGAGWGRLIGALALLGLAATVLVSLAFAVGWWVGAGG